MSGRIQMHFRVARKHGYLSFHFRNSSVEVCESRPLMSIHENLRPEVRRQTGRVRLREKSRAVKTTAQRAGKRFSLHLVAQSAGDDQVQVRVQVESELTGEDLARRSKELQYDPSHRQPDQNRGTPMRARHAAQLTVETHSADWRSSTR